jgi:hypothetical protein
MKRHLLLACLAAALPGAVLATLPTTAHAQATRAYAPEDLRQLSRADRARVIEREYADQSRGRRIPDDQLEFYLDQVNSGWGFSRIKQDIATSLRGNGNWNGGGNGNGNTGTIRCESTDNRRRVCNTGWRGATLVRQLSNTQCIEGRNWGSSNGSIWVSNGCRAEFAQGPSGSGGNWNGNAGTIRCESTDNRRRVCNTGWRGATLVRQLSKTQCVEGRNWGSGNGTVWVSNGCRAEFTEGRGGGWGNGGGNWNNGNSNYSVTCSSDSNRMRSCAWDRRQGRPVVIEQLSSTQCIEGRNWGFSGNSVWVNGGCRARFGSR